MTSLKAFKPGTLKDALDVLRPGDTIAIAAYSNEPQEFMMHLHEAAEQMSGMFLWVANLMNHYPVVSPAFNSTGKVELLSTFYGVYPRAVHSGNHISYAPANMHNTGAVMVETKRPTVFVAAVPPPDEDGSFRMSTSLQWEKECAEAAERIILEVNPAIPRTNCAFSIPPERVTCCFSSDRPLPILPDIPVTDDEKRIGEYVSTLISDGDCIQLGIGGLPNAVANALMDKKDLGIHTEMMTSIMCRMMKKGVVTNERKNVNRGVAVCAFAWGEQELYDFLRDNDKVRFKPASYVNDVSVIASNDNMVSVNTALQIDLTGQICSESLGHRQFSGTGGAGDFAYGAYHSKGGRGIIALRSTAKNGTLSRILPMLTPGSVVTISRNLADYVVTEYGIAKLRGKTVRQRVENLIAVCHPDFRSELKRKADELMLW